VTVAAAEVKPGIEPEVVDIGAQMRIRSGVRRVADGTAKRQARAALSQAADLLTGAAAARLRRSRGVEDVSVVRAVGVPSPPADAVLSITIDRYGMRLGLEREIWVRASAVWAPTDPNRPRSTAFAYGSGRAVRRLLAKGYARTDAQLLADAVDGVARSLVTALETGEGNPMAGDLRVAVLPAGAPPQVAKRFGGSDYTVQVALPALVRQRDVLLQPDLPLTVALVRESSVAAALAEAEMNPTAEEARRVGQAVAADYALASRVERADLIDREVRVMDAGVERSGIERQADVRVWAAMVRVSDGAVVWEDARDASTVSKTEYARHRARLRSDEKCVVDAVRLAYAYIRSSFADYRRRCER